MLGVSKIRIEEDFGSLLRRKRKEKGFTLSELEEKTGISISHLSRAERNERKLSVKYIQRIANVLSIDEKFLLSKAGYIKSLRGLVEYIHLHKEMPTNLYDLPKHVLTEYLEEIIKHSLRSSNPTSYETIQVCEMSPDFNLDNFENKDTLIDYKKVETSEIIGLNGPIYLKVNKPDSFIDGINKGDLILISQTNSAKDKSINLIYIENKGVMLRRLFELDDHYLVQGNNTGEKPILIKKSEITILGVAIELRRDL
jgi:transcriptional regulator with XRE-family HTH domain